MNVGNRRESPLQLAIETTGRTGSMAIMRGAEVLLQRQVGTHSRTAAAIGPCLDEMLSWCRSEPTKLDLISVANGPGSFTGLRIGVTAANMLSYALQVPLVCVDSLAAIAAVVFTEHADAQSLIVALDAYRGQVFTGRFERGEILPDADAIPADWTPHPTSVQIVCSETWATLLASGLEAGCQLAGDAKPFADRADQRLARSAVDAFGVGLIAGHAADRSLLTDPFEVVPRYLRPSAAEEALG
ncbi:MAG: tRNA (adenosine(37)-N6)-threonylcarbamoyltransferase complex dimerization subunit type 1 TsaB [Novipirellula sp. JB048]